MTKIGKITYYLFALIAVAYGIRAWVSLPDDVAFTRYAVFGCFCLLMSIWTFVDSKVDL